MIKLETEELDQENLKDYVYGLKDKLSKLTKKNSRNFSSQDYFPFKKKMHHFADQYLTSKGILRPMVPMKVDKALLEDFVQQSNNQFRHKYAKLWAQMLHEDKRINMAKR